MPLFIRTLQKRLEEPLPGFSAQFKMISKKLVETEIHSQKSRRTVPQEYRTAGVMALLYRKEAAWHTTLMQRPESKYAHSRQVSFPGGGTEMIDPSLEATALRETEEEFGIPRQNIEVLGALTQLYIPVSNYLVHPFVGYLPEEPTFVPDRNEVAEILEIPLHELMDKRLRKFKDITTPSGYKVREAPYFDLKGKVVWGATAMMLSEFATILEELEEVIG